MSIQIQQLSKKQKATAADETERLNQVNVDRSVVDVDTDATTTGTSACSSRQQIRNSDIHTMNSLMKKTGASTGSDCHSHLLCSEEKELICDSTVVVATTTHIILFYKYHPLSNDIDTMRIYQQILHRLCTTLSLQGRILIGTSNATEGINGTLAGEYENVLSFTHALLYYNTQQIPEYETLYTNNISNSSGSHHDINTGDDDDSTTVMKQRQRRTDAMEIFWRESAHFFRHTINQPELRMESPNDFKWSSVMNNEKNCAKVDHEGSVLSQQQQPPSATSAVVLFPDLHIKLVSELIGTGCKEFAQIPIEETSIGYLSPVEWHEHLQSVLSNNNNYNGNEPPTKTTTSNNNCECTNDAIIIDCRNTKEYQIGHFTNAINPNTTTFAQFIPWVQNNQLLMENKTVYMYCTGGIRCEKASAYIRRTVPTTKQIYHLHGGIHKYLERFGTPSPPLSPAVNHAIAEENNNDNRDIHTDNTTETKTPTISIWKGRNFVFDGRGAAMEPAVISNKTEHDSGDDDDKNEAIPRITDATRAGTCTIVGQCAYCQSPYDQFDPHCVCTVCREPILICRQCQSEDRKESPSTTNHPPPTGLNVILMREYHCSNHQHLQYCYFTNLNIFTNVEELQDQLQELVQHMTVIAIGRRYKQKRKTIQKQMTRVQERILEMETKAAKSSSSSTTYVSIDDNQERCISCRNCGSTDCVDGRCWGFYGLKRKERLLGSNNTENTEQPLHDPVVSINKEESTVSFGKASLLQVNPQQKRTGHSKSNKRQKNEAGIEELIQLNIALPPAMYRDDVTGIRVPPCSTRVVQCTMKAKWCGQSILKVIQSEFVELAKTDVLNEVVAQGLLRLNGKQISLNGLSSISLKGSDILGRIIHWHEAPVLVPKRIDVERVIVPSDVLDAYGADSDDTGTIYICNKPSSVPTHPAGPYLSNTLTMMVEGQEGLKPQSLYPLHRTDRVTSGLTLCSTSLAVSRAFHKSLTDGYVNKMYLAKVDGKFISSSDEDVITCASIWKPEIGFCRWSDNGNFVLVDAPIYTLDPAGGIRSIDSLGKPSKSLFKRLYFDSNSNTSVILCYPITGRNHQLRVHLLALGFPIINDVQYGGRRDTEALHQSHVDSAAVDAMIRCRDNTSEKGEHRVSSLSEDDVVAAKKACICCRTGGKDGILSSFTNAQMLIEGHSICLHAYRYRIRMVPPKSTKQTHNNDYDCTSQLAEFDFQVRRPPTWTDEKYLENISWLDLPS